VSKPPRSPKQPRSEFGLKVRAAKPFRRWAVDNVDAAFLAQLGPNERAWLEQFNSEYYDARFPKRPLHRTKDQRRACYRAQNYAYLDVMSRGEVELGGATYELLAEGQSSGGDF
jgi:hypothetical protein